MLSKRVNGVWRTYFMWCGVAVEGVGRSMAASILNGMENV